jgi:lysophospholipid acyltransferase (LPLAT)-like uncharacterized protein
MSFRKFRDYFWATGEPWNSIRSWLAPRLLMVVHSILMCTVRFSSSGVRQAWQRRSEGGTLLVTWHDLTFIPLHLLRDQDIYAMISTSRAGKVQAAFWRLYGWPTLWGSSKKREGIRALRQILNGLREGRMFAFTPDGPKGPRHKVQPGVVYLASNASAAIIPVGVAASSCWRLPTWDKYLIPRPFARVHIHMGEPVDIPSNLSREQMQEWQTRMETILHQTTETAAARLSS